MHKLLFNYYLKKLNYTASPELLHDLAERSDGFNVRSIQTIAQTAYSFAQVRRSSQMSIDDICAAFYYDQKIKLPDMNMRARILKYYIKQKPHNIVEEAALEKIVLPIAQDTIDNFTGRELKSIVENAFDALETDRKNLFDESNCLYYLYIGLYKELLKKAEPVAVTATIKSIPNATSTSSNNTDIQSRIRLIETVKLKDQDQFKQHATIGNYQGSWNYLDFVNTYKPSPAMQTALILYLLSNSGIKINSQQDVIRISKEIDGLSCYAIKEVMKDFTNEMHMRSIKEFNTKEFNTFAALQCRMIITNRIIKKQHKEINNALIKFDDRLRAVEEFDRQTSCTIS